VAGILRQRFLIVRGGKLIDRTQHDFALQLFDRHAVVNEIPGEKLQQFGIAWAFTAETEVAWGIDDACSEIRLPDAVGDHPHRDRLLDDQLRKLHAATALIQRDRVARRENTQEVARDFWPEFFRITP